MSAASYDAIPYTSYPYDRTHPDRLATVGALFGMRPTLPSQARILELGCASGGTLLPLAEQLPGAELVGIDLSPRQVALGNEAIAGAGLLNVALHVGDLTEIDAGWGEFDYIVCHGVLSWVSEAVRERILEVIAQRLRPQGIGLVSYNTYPGWHLRQSVREMMLYHVAQFEDPTRRAEQAKALLDFVAEHGPSAGQSGNAGFSALMKREAELLRKLPDGYLFHEHLEEHNTPLYFHELEARLRAHGLAYLGDADVATMMTSPLPDEAAQQLQEISPDLVRLEQYLDFVRGRQFRTTLVCRGDVPLSRKLGGERVLDRLVALSPDAASSTETIDLAPGVTQAFQCGGITVRSDVPITKAALQVLLARKPMAVPFSSLLAKARVVLGEAGLETKAGDESTLAADVVRCYLGAGVRLRTEAAACVAQAGPRPRVSAYVRWQAANLDFVTSVLHTRVELDLAARVVVQMLDGTRDRAALCAGLADRVADGTLTLTRDGEPLADRAQWVEPLTAVLDHTLAAIAGGALLLA
ncbi:MAG: methyltransferase regulatory domain-containing protein [Nannocystaceae bacterium]|nr:methyltransferase regulatory domain-containing protein [Nannocystaceae bacterium]